jgi:hypothetical protein
VGKHCSNPYYFLKKTIAIILNQLNIKKKSTNNFEKNHNKKTMWGNTVAIHNVLMKKIIKLNY